MLSSWSSVISGVPQGSICGPLMFNILVNDMSSVVQISKIVMYTDDARLYVTGDAMQDIN